METLLQPCARKSKADLIYLTMHAAGERNFWIVTNSVKIGVFKDDETRIRPFIHPTNTVKPLNLFSCGCC